MIFRTALLSCAALVAAAALGLTVLSPGSAQKDMSEAERTRIEQIVRDYLMEHPELVVEALREFDSRQALMAEAQAQEHLARYLPQLLAVETGYAAGAGEDEAKVAVIELFDYHCGVCRRAMPLMSDLIREEGDVRVIFQELPVLREESEYAAKAALATRGQNKYTDMHFAMMKSSGILSPERIADIARQVGVDVEAMNETIEAGTIDEELTKIYSMAVDLGVQGTPTFIIASMDGSYSRLVPSWQPDAILESIEEARKVAQRG